MEIYATSKNSGPSWSTPEQLSLVYLGSSLEYALKAVGDFKKYERPLPDNFNLYSAIPRSTAKRMLHFYMADGWWYSVEEVLL